MIKIISGVYGRVIGSRVQPVAAGDPPFTLADPEAEARLVRQGVAVYVPDESAAAPPAEDPIAGNPAEADVAGDQPPKYSADMKREQLEAIAAEYGIDASGAKNKAEIVAMIDEALATEEEQPPAFTPEPPVGE